MFQLMERALNSDPNRDKILENIRTLRERFDQSDERKAA
jgi:hypothetical protein